MFWGVGLKGGCGEHQPHHCAQGGGIGVKGQTEAGQGLLTVLCPSVLFPTGSCTEQMG